MPPTHETALGRVGLAGPALLLRSSLRLPRLLALVGVAAGVTVPELGGFRALSDFRAKRGTAREWPPHETTD